MKFSHYTLIAICVIFPALSHSQIDLSELGCMALRPINSNLSTGCSWLIQLKKIPFELTTTTDQKEISEYFKNNPKLDGNISNTYKQGISNYISAAEQIIQNLRPLPTTTTTLECNYSNIAEQAITREQYLIDKLDIDSKLSTLSQNLEILDYSSLVITEYQDFAQKIFENKEYTYVRETAASIFLDLRNYKLQLTNAKSSTTKLLKYLSKYTLSVGESLAKIDNDNCSCLHELKESLYEKKLISLIHKRKHPRVTA